jgi:cytochrome P450
MPLPEPADATFTVLLREATQTGARQRRALAQLIDHLIAGERDADQDELRGLIAYCHERIDLLNSSDADFIVSMKGIVTR